MIAAKDPASKLKKDIYISLYALVFVRVRVGRWASAQVAKFLEQLWRGSGSGSGLCGVWRAEYRGLEGVLVVTRLWFHTSLGFTQYVFQSCRSYP